MLLNFYTEPHLVKIESPKHKPKSNGLREPPGKSNILFLFKSFFLFFGFSGKPNHTGNV